MPNTLVPAALLAACLALPAAAQDDPRNPVGPLSPLTVTSASGTRTIQVEKVSNDADRARGLMFRTKLGPDRGMLFDFGGERPVAFWMRNTLIPLDMVFIRADGVVANVHEGARPHDETPIPSEGPVRYVLEVEGGAAKGLGLAPGATVAPLP